MAARSRRARRRWLRRRLARTPGQRRGPVPPSPAWSRPSALRSRLMSPDWSIIAPEMQNGLSLAQAVSRSAVRRLSCARSTPSIRRGLGSIPILPEGRVNLAHTAAPDQSRFAHARTDAEAPSLQSDPCPNCRTWRSSPTPSTPPLPGRPVLAVEAAGPAHRAWHAGRAAGAGRPAAGALPPPRQVPVARVRARPGRRQRHADRPAAAGRRPLG